MNKHLQRLKLIQIEQLQDNSYDIAPFAFKSFLNDIQKFQMNPFYLKRDYKIWKIVKTALITLENLKRNGLNLSSEKFGNLHMHLIEELWIEVLQKNKHELYCQRE